MTVPPKCGRMVGFNAGDYHGVRAVTKGRRCAIAMWYTMDPNTQELARLQAWKKMALQNVVQGETLGSGEENEKFDYFEEAEERNVNKEGANFLTEKKDIGINIKIHVEANDLDSEHLQNNDISEKELEFVKETYNKNGVRDNGNRKNNKHGEL